jgi:hypothetical protein
MCPPPIRLQNRECTWLADGICISMHASAKTLVYCRAGEETLEVRDHVGSSREHGPLLGDRIGIRLTHRTQEV